MVWPVRHAAENVENCSNSGMLSGNKPKFIPTNPIQYTHSYRTIITEAENSVHCRNRICKVQLQKSAKVLLDILLIHTRACKNYIL